MPPGMFSRMPRACAELGDVNEPSCLTPVTTISSRLCWPKPFAYVFCDAKSDNAIRLNPPIMQLGLIRQKYSVFSFLLYLFNVL